MNNLNSIKEIASKYNSFYVYDEKTLKENVNKLKDNFKSAYFIYSLKTNPHKKVANSVLKENIGTDAASLNEVMQSFENGLKKEEIYYSAPGKSYNDIKNSIEISTIIADSINEVFLIDKIAKEKGMCADIGVRINPNFNFFSNEFIPSKFGIDENQLFEKLDEFKNLSNINITGIHVHLRSQELNLDILKAYYDNIFLLAKKFIQKAEKNLKFINFGSGIGIDYKEDDIPLNLKVLGEYFDKRAAEFKNEYKDILLIIESGRFIAGKAGKYITKVADTKISGNTKYVILHNTLNGFIRPSMEQLILSYSKEENPFASEPLFTSKSAFSFEAITSNIEKETVTLVGNLCTSTDVIKKELEIEKLDIGDLISINNAGSYAAVLSPMQFSNQGEIPEVFINLNGEVVL